MTIFILVIAAAEAIAHADDIYFIGRGLDYAVAVEGSLKLKEISYVHSEAMPAGELKHGPLALVDHDMPVVAVAPNNKLLEKLISNIEEVRARGGEMYVIADAEALSSQIRSTPSARSLMRRRRSGASASCRSAAYSATDRPVSPWSRRYL